MDVGIGIGKVKGSLAICPEWGCGDGGGGYQSHEWNRLRAGEFVLSGLTCVGGVLSTFLNLSLYYMGSI